MAWWNSKKDSGNGEKAGTISRMIDDLTNLEINTILKGGMTAAPQPDSIEETLQLLLEEYKARMAVIENKNDVEPDASRDFSTCRSFAQLHSRLLALRSYLDQNKMKLIEFDYIRVLRMISFCEYLNSKSVSKERSGMTNLISIKPQPQASVNTNSVYELDLMDISTFRLILDTRDSVKIKRLFDLGTENVVMQTRFGLDGDVVTRVEENFASKPKQLIIDIHDRHTDLSLKYWKHLVGLVQDIVTKIIR